VLLLVLPAPGPATGPATATATATSGASSRRRQLARMDVPRSRDLILSFASAWPPLPYPYRSVGDATDGHGLLAVEGHSRSSFQRARAPHAYFAAPVRGRRAVPVPI